MQKVQSNSIAEHDRQVTGNRLPIGPPTADRSTDKNQHLKIQDKRKSKNVFQLIEAERTKHSKKPIETINRVVNKFGLYCFCIYICITIIKR